MPQPIETLIQKLLRDLVSEYITYPQHLEIKTSVIGKICIVEWWAHAADCGKIIGAKTNSNFQPLQNLFKIIGEANGYEVKIEWLGNPKIGKKERIKPFKQNPEWPRARILTLLKRIGEAVSSDGIAEVKVFDVASKVVANLQLATTESEKKEAELKSILRLLFGIIGLANGQILIVEVTRELEHEHQPATAAGRFAK